MGNKTSNPFVYGDPRFLDGGSSVVRLSYNDPLKITEEKPPVKFPGKPTTSLFKAANRNGQSVSQGKSSYHGNYNTNCFVGVSDLTMPTVGIELETCLRGYNKDYSQMFTNYMYSNWFHAENDGSLDPEHSGTYGYEIVTSVLPARIYRNLETWTGLQNLLTPIAQSFHRNDTGLHVHVGVDWFMNTSFPACCPAVLRLLGKLLTCKLYYSFLPRSLADKVFLRPATRNYCHETHNSEFVRPISECSGAELVDSCVLSMLLTDCECQGAWVSYGMNLIENAGSVNGKSESEFWDGYANLDGGHDKELNSSPSRTIEFRRGKGTLNALSIHRMIELCVTTVMYAGHVIDNPSEKVSTVNMLSYIIDNTKSEALKSIVKKELEKCA